MWPPLSRSILEFATKKIFFRIKAEKFTSRYIKKTIGLYWRECRSCRRKTCLIQAIFFLMQEEIFLIANSRVLQQIIISQVTSYHTWYTCYLFFFQSELFNWKLEAAGLWQFLSNLDNFFLLKHNIFKEVVQNIYPENWELWLNLLEGRRTVFTQSSCSCLQRESFCQLFWNKSCHIICECINFMYLFNSCISRNSSSNWNKYAE